MSVALACDQCGRWVRKTDDHAVAWIEVSRGDAYSLGTREFRDEGDPFSEVRHFCASQCAGDWFSALAASDEESESATDHRGLPLGRTSGEAAHVPAAYHALPDQVRDPPVPGTPPASRSVPPRR